MLVIGDSSGATDVKFSGVALVSERMLLGHCTAKGVAPDEIFRGEKLRTSHPSCPVAGREGADSPFALSVWQHLTSASISPLTWVAWNAFPFHPHHERRPLADCTPARGDLLAARRHLEALRILFPKATLYAAGPLASNALSEFQMPFQILPAQK
ncbi:hypothetical protein F6X40_10755 [Paraburkholderia sp. UCT31]|uniref:hypothetical protein n=1 Tax=Paraburkholderia sp. UCT31 TaxID=2615209 RepID=UPI0016551BA1|nr:hypothetical protein [Paraburkholderia sp. UCT31]MBC8737288.1 hypothetical protein [Paraburkholderia sp. UCT31]